MDKLGIEEWLVLAVMSTYTGAKTVARTVYGNSKCFDVKVGMHRGSALSPFVFVTEPYLENSLDFKFFPWKLCMYNMQSLTVQSQVVNHTLRTS